MGSVPIGGGDPLAIGAAQKWSWCQPLQFLARYGGAGFLQLHPGVIDYRPSFRPKVFKTPNSFVVFALTPRHFRASAGQRIG